MRLVQHARRVEVEQVSVVDYGGGWKSQSQAVSMAIKQTHMWYQGLIDHLACDDTPTDKMRDMLERVLPSSE